MSEWKAEAHLSSTHRERALAQITAIYPYAANRLTIRQLVGTCKAVRLSLPRRLQLLRIEDEERIGSLIAND
jgi:hypothetical protein